MYQSGQAGVYVTNTPHFLVTVGEERSSAHRVIQEPAERDSSLQSPQQKKNEAGFPLAIKHFLSEVLHQHMPLLFIFPASHMLKGLHSSTGSGVRDWLGSRRRQTCILCPVARESGTLTSLGSPLSSLMVVFIPRWGPLIRVSFGNPSGSKMRRGRR